MEFEELLALNVFGNTVYSYLMSVGIFVLTWIAIFIVKNVILIQMREIAKRTKTTLDDKIVEYIQSVSLFFYFIWSVYVSTSFLALPDLVTTVIYYLLLLTIGYYIVKLANKFAEYFFGRIENEQKRKFHENDFSQLHLMRDIVKAVVWFLAVLLFLSNLGFDITTLVASLGIGGIAIAFALQSVLSDVFASFSIYFDKPFKRGDFIVVGNESGTIKKIGLKTTRIESLQGEEIVVSNRILVDSNIHNYKKMNYRRPIFTVGVAYGTPVGKLEKIPGYIKEIIENMKDSSGKTITTVERIHFKNLGPSSLNYEIMYTIGSNDYNKYMDVQQGINLAILKKFKKEKIEIAYPTQTVYLRKE